MSSMRSSPSSKAAPPHRAEAPPAFFWRRWVGDDPASTSPPATVTAPEPPPAPSAPPKASQSASIQTAASPRAIGNGRSGYINPNSQTADASLQFDPNEQAHIDAMLRSAQETPAPVKASGIEVQSVNVGRATATPQAPTAALRDDSLVTAKVLDEVKPATAPIRKVRKTPKAPKSVALRLKKKPTAKTDTSAHDTSEETRPAPAMDAPFRILIVEDDRGQALFAQSILQGAGMEAEVEMEADKVLAAIARFRPDLVLMDLHMPGRDGVALTQDIRATAALAKLPVVFLTGDPDPEKQYEVLESGADDYLTKPIRPRHLVLSVSNRIRRMRQNNAPKSAAPTINPETGLPTRTHVMQQLAATVKTQATAGLFFVEIIGALELRGKYDYANFEHLMLQVGHSLAQAASPHTLTRLGDASFLVLGEGLSGDALDAFACNLCTALGHAGFTLRDDTPQQLRGAVGYAGLPQDFVDAGSALEATERAAQDARAQVSGVSAYVADAPQDELTHLLADAELEVAFQPIISLATDDNEAQYQVLLRLHRSDGTLVPAAQALPAAEQAGRIVELDRQVMESVLATLAQSQAEGNPLRLFVAQSPRSLARDDATEWLFGALARHHADPRQLVVELRLADASAHGVTLGQFCQRLISVGVQFALNQFEPGEDADALLDQLPLSYLRLSPRYAEVHKQPELAEELRAIVERAHQIGIQIIGEHVEEEAAMSTMWISGVDFIQGDPLHSVDSGIGSDLHSTAT